MVRCLVFVIDLFVLCDSDTDYSNVGGQSRRQLFVYSFHPYTNDYV